MDVPEGSQRQLDNRQKGNDTRIDNLISKTTQGISEQASNWLKDNKSKIMDKMDGEYYSHRAQVKKVAAIKMRDYSDALGSAQRDSRGLPISGYGTQFRRGGPERARLRDEVKRGMMKGLTEKQALQNIYEGKVHEAMRQYANDARAAIPDLVTSEYNKVVAKARTAAAAEGAAANAAAKRERDGEVQRYVVSGTNIAQGELQGGKKKKTKKRKTNRKKAKAKTNKRKKHGRKSKTHKKRRYGRKSRRH